MPYTVSAVQVPESSVSPEAAKTYLVAFLEWVEDFFEAVDRESRYAQSLANMFEPNLIQYLSDALAELQQDDVFARAKRSVAQLSATVIRDHGLAGYQLQWKLANVQFASSTFMDLISPVLIGPMARAFDRLLDAIDALLDSILDGIAGAGAIKELKEAIRNSVRLLDSDLE